MKGIDFDEFFKDNFDTTGIEDNIYNQIAKDMARCIDIDLAKTPLVDILTGYTRYKIQELEIERLNNIINEIEKYLIEEIEYYEKQIKYYKNNKDLRSGILDLVGEYEGEKVCFEDMLDKLQELKGDGSNEINK